MPMPVSENRLQRCGGNGFSAAQLLNCDAKNVLVGSTGVIGMPLDMPKVRSGIKEAISKLSEEGGHDAAEAIMTTDLVLKEIAVEFEIQGQK